MRPYNFAFQYLVCQSGEQSYLTTNATADICATIQRWRTEDSEAVFIDNNQTDIVLILQWQPQVWRV